jgi:hypothetical protein
MISLVHLAVLVVIGSNHVTEQAAPLDRRRPLQSPSSVPLFQFTSLVYNVSIQENARGRIFAVSNSPLRIGVPIPPDPEAQIRFKIVEVGKQ